MIVLNKILKIVLFSSFQLFLAWVLVDLGWELVREIYPPQTSLQKWVVTSNEFILFTGVVAVLMNFLMEINPFRELASKVLLSIIGVLLLAFLFSDDLIERYNRMAFLMFAATVTFGSRFFPLEYYWVAMKVRHFKRKRAKRAA